MGYSVIEISMYYYTILSQAILFNGLYLPLFNKFL
jgi:hypothetical protein